MNKYILILLTVSLFACKKEPISDSPFDIEACGTWHIANNGSDSCRYEVRSYFMSNYPTVISVTSDTVIEINMRTDYYIIYNDTAGIKQIIEHHTKSELVSFTDSLPCTIR